MFSNVLNILGLILKINLEIFIETLQFGDQHFWSSFLSSTLKVSTRMIPSKLVNLDSLIHL